MKALRLFLLPVMALFAGPALAELKASDALRLREASLRLLAERDATGALRGALELRLEAGYKTYWKNPGDSGVAPQFDFSGSTGAGAIQVRMPFPQAFDDGAGGRAFGYRQAVLFPFEGRAEADAQLVLKLDFAVCSTLCIPLAAALTLPLAKAPAAEAAARELLSETILRLPQPLDEGRIEIRRLGEAEFSLRLATPVPAGELGVFPFGAEFFEVKSVEAAGEGQVLVRVSGQRVAGKRFSPLGLTYGTPSKSFERVLDVDAAR